MVIALIVTNVLWQAIVVDGTEAVFILVMTTFCEDVRAVVAAMMRLIHIVIPQTFLWTTFEIKATRTPLALFLRSALSMWITLISTRFRLAVSWMNFVGVVFVISVIARLAQALLFVLAYRTLLCSLGSGSEYVSPFIFMLAGPKGSFRYSGQRGLYLLCGMDGDGLVDCWHFIVGSGRLAVEKQEQDGCWPRFAVVHLK